MQRFYVVLFANPSKMWDLNTGECKMTLTRHLGSVKVLISQYYVSALFIRYIVFMSSTK